RARGHQGPVRALQPAAHQPGVRDVPRGARGARVQSGTGKPRRAALPRGRDSLGADRLSRGRTDPQGLLRGSPARPLPGAHGRYPPAVGAGARVRGSAAGAVTRMIDAIRQFFDKHIKTSGEDAGAGGHDPLHVASAALMIEMMRMDGEVTGPERERVLRALQQKFGLAPAETAEVVGLAEGHARAAADEYR